MSETSAAGAIGLLAACLGGLAASYPKVADVTMSVGPISAAEVGRMKTAR